VIHQVAATSRISVRRGEIVLCATTATSSLLAALAPDLRDRVARNAAAGKPAQITLAEAGAMRTANLPFELRAASAGLVAELLDARAGAFVWEPAALPEFVETYGRPIPLAALALDHARRTGVTGTVELLDQAYERARRVTPRLAGLALDATEQRMLALVDGRTTTRDLAARAGLSPDRAAATVARLYTADLIAPSAGPQVAAARTLAVIDADREGVIAPLRARLRRWPQPVEVVELDPDRPLAAAALELHAEMVWIGVAALTRDVIDHELPVLAKAGAWVVCVLDAPNPALAHQMLQAGVFAVLTKPVHVHEIERLMARPRTQEPPCPPSSS
jgi:hypothetical protein